MEDKNGIKRILQSMQTGFHDQVNALKIDVQDARNNVETMLELSAKLEGKTTSQEKIIEEVVYILKDQLFQIVSAKNLARINGAALVNTILISLILALTNENKRGDWLRLLIDITEIINGTHREIANAKNISSLQDIMDGYFIKAANISKKYDELSIST